MSGDMKFEAWDEFVLEVRKTHNIPELASHKDMETTIMKLLQGNETDLDDAITLVMNRHVGADEDIAPEIMFVKSPAIVVSERYAMLLIYAEMFGN